MTCVSTNSANKARLVLCYYSHSAALFLSCERIGCAPQRRSTTGISKCIHEKTSSDYGNGRRQPERHWERDVSAAPILSWYKRVKRLTAFDASDLPVQIAGEIIGFDELAWVDAHERKHVSRAVPLALAASTEALTQAGIDSAKLSLADNVR